MFQLLQFYHWSRAMKIKKSGVLPDLCHIAEIA